MVDVRTLVSRYPDGIFFNDLLELAHAEIRRTITEKQLLRDLEAIADEVEGRWRIRTSYSVATEGPQELSIASLNRPQRIVVVDCESLVRQVPLAPDYKERHLFQIAAQRIGLDSNWVSSEPAFEVWLKLKQEFEPLIRDRPAYGTYQAQKRPHHHALAAFAAYIQDADFIVAYNGTGLDFPLLERAFELAELAQPRRPRQVDALYLGYALWPVPPNNHRLGDLLKRLNPELDTASWHNAATDCQMLVDLLEEGTKVVREWPRELQELVAAVGAHSEPWQMLFGLMSDIPPRNSLSEMEIRACIRRSLQDHQPVRATRREQISGSSSSDRFGGTRLEPPPFTEFSLPISITTQSISNRVDVHKLAEAAKGAAAKRRPSQDKMAEQMRQWIWEDRAALVEAPTGTGKSFAMIAIALEWIASDPQHRVIISTFTKQLQQQLAADLETIDNVAHGLLNLSDLVKGKGNRLSLRGLLIALTEIVAAASHPRTKRPAALVDDPRYADLVLYLTLRLLAKGSNTENWLARSVDTNDIPAFFIDYIPRNYELYLSHLSQGKAGEFPLESTELLSQYTNSVREALTEKRLIVANHALLFANLDDLKSVGPETLLLIDEAHQLEAAATSALGAEFASPELERTTQDLVSWLAERDAHSEPEILTMREAADDLQAAVLSEMLTNAATRAFDSLKQDQLNQGYARRLIVASPLEGTVLPRHIVGFRQQLAAIHVPVEKSWRALRNVPPRQDVFDEDRRLSLVHRLDELRGSLKAIVGSVGRIQNPNTEALSNDLVWAEEILPDRPGSGRFRFRVRQSPIELREETRYQEFLDTFSRLYLISATLRVSDSFQFMRDRLALSPSVGEIALESPFDYSQQARLFVMSDFPSWAEQQGAAEHTVAQQVAGFASEMGADNDKGGAIVLTTSKRSAAGIGEALAEERARHEAAWSLTAADIIGNTRAVRSFNDYGGVLVGTKGLWQGIDPLDHLNLVWINKLPFASFEDPLIKTRKALVASRAEEEGVEDPDSVANLRYYLPLAAIELRQAVGRLIRSAEHRGIVIISDRKLSGPTKLRRQYREVFLGSLDCGLLISKDGDRAGGNVMPMTQVWREAWQFLSEVGLISPERLPELTRPPSLEQFTQLSETLEIHKLRMTDDDVKAICDADGLEALADEVERRAERIAQLLKRNDGLTLSRADKPQQADAIRAVAKGQDVLGLLPTGYGKSFVFQLPALVLPGVTVVVSPLVSLMTDQALDLNRAIGGAVRALVAPMRESNSRTGKQEVLEQLTGHQDHGIRMVYLSPERLAQSQFRKALREGVQRGIVRRIALDEAHCFVTWGEDFRPSFKRAEQLILDLKGLNPRMQIIALTATATPTVRVGLQDRFFRGSEDTPNGHYCEIQGNPIRPNLALYRLNLAGGEGGPITKASIVEEVVSTVQGHTILYTLTVKEAIALYNHIRTLLGEGEKDRIYLFHGRLSDHDKANVSNAFKDAPGQEDDPENFRPLIVVATSAFGLGIDRPDVRTVFCVSPPTDLSALYQQVGRAGRDGEPASGLMLATRRSFATIDFMTRSNLQHNLVNRIAQHVLTSVPPIDMTSLAEEFVEKDLQAKRIEPQEAKYAEGQYRTYVARVYAELNTLDAIEDLGDFPDQVKIVRIQSQVSEPIVQSLLDTLFSGPDRSSNKELFRLWQAVDWPSFDIHDVGQLWSELLTLHASGYIDVSQQVTERYLTHYNVNSGYVPSDFPARFERRHQDLATEVSLLKNFFNDHDCVNQAFANYFNHQLVEAPCQHSETRCSCCWGRRECAGQPPLLHQALMRTTSRRGSADARRRREEHRLEQDILLVLKTRRQHGLSAKYLTAMLKGEDRVAHPDTHGAVTWKPLWPSLIYHRAFGTFPGITEPKVNAALKRLASRGETKCLGNRRWIVPRFATSLP